jgi:uncharacterized phosphosugar-binding protein
MMQKSEEYLLHAAELLRQAARDQLGNINRFARLLADTLQARRTVFLFGTGHSSLLAQEIFYRAGGLVRLQPMLEAGLMLHESASKSTRLERIAAYAEVLMAHYAPKAGDLLLIISNSGRNPLCVELALQAKAAGCTVAALTSAAHSLAGASRHKSGKRLLECADLVLDNLGCVGDACVSYEGFPSKAAPTSTVLGAAFLQAAVAQAVEYLLEDGVRPEIFFSSNVDEGDAKNAGYLEAYRKEIRFL